MTIPLRTPAPLLSAIETELADTSVSRPKKISALRDLFQLFTQERDRLKHLVYLDIPKFRDAFLRYHLPLNVARAACALEQVRVLRPEVSNLADVVDLGAGLGSASLATLLTLPGPARTYALHDRSKAALKVARRLLERCAGALGGTAVKRVVTLDSLLPALPSMPRRALVWLCMVLNELEACLPRGLEAELFLAKLAERIDSPSVVVIVEPALRAPGRSLLELHDKAIASGLWRVIAPCTHQCSCPLLKARDRSWCHFHFRWDAPRLVREVADPLRLGWESPSFAFLALERSEAPAAQDPLRARVIGDRMRLSGGKDGVYVCQEGQRKVLERPPKGIERGDLVRIDGAGAKVEVPWKGEYPGAGVPRGPHHRR